MRITKLVRPRPHPCLTAEIIDKMAAAQPANGFPANTDSLPGPLSPRERLLLHFGAFLIGSFNLLIINLANSPGHLWFWPWVAAWAGALVLHLGIVLLVAHRRRPHGAGAAAGR